MTVADLPDAVQGASAWYRPTLADDDRWVYRFNADELSELESAIDSATVSGRPMLEVTSAEFALPTLAPTFATLRREVLSGCGVVLLRGLPVLRWPVERTAMALWGIGAHLGNARSQNADGHLLGHVRDMGLTTADPNVRIYQTRERQQYHTDTCDIVALLCLQTAARGGLSAIVSSMTIYNELRRREPELAALLFDAFPTDRRGEIPAGEKPYYMIPVYHYYHGFLSAIYSRSYINSAQRNHAAAPRLSASHIAALDSFDALANDPALNFEMAFEPGDVQLLHNHTILHDRTAFQDHPEPARKRHLLRLWLAAPDARPLPDAYAQCYGSVEIGTRGGITVPGAKLNAPLYA